MRPAGLLTGLVGMAAVAAVVGIGAEHFLRDRNGAADEAGGPPPQPAAPEALAPGAQPDAVAKSGIEALFAPAPSLRGARLAPSKPINLMPVDVPNPLVERAGVLKIGDRMLQLADVAPTDPARACTNADGQQWPCGTVARTAFRSFLRGRTLTCDLPGEDWQGTVTAQCRYAKIDIGQWLVKNGWAEAEAGSPLASAGDEARNARRGMYGDGPRKDGPSTLAPAPAKDDPLNPI